ncbi:MAG: 2Fe-2S iron-sulfur cluster binding domain-containing protein, partial [Muribaculaceae bacterium]|nr:2Fe-2S iron-sulfur cluster binding domain-containing protein [Muribaculaceae bacterium]
MSLTILAAVSVFLLITIVLVIVLLVAKKYLVNSGDVEITMNGDKHLTVKTGASLLSTLANDNIFLSSACGGKGSCGQCKVQIESGAGEILPTEAVHFTRKQIKENWRLACQVKVKENLDIKVPASVLDVREWECEVIS